MADGTLGRDGRQCRQSWHRPDDHPMAGGVRGPALAIGMAGAIAGAASAWHNRDALSRGFVTPSADGLERGGADVVIALIAFGLMIRQSWQPSISAVLALWMLSCFLAHAMTMTAERLFAAPGKRRGMAINALLAVLASILLLIASIYR